MSKLNSAPYRYYHTLSFSFKVKVVDYRQRQKSTLSEGMFKVICATFISIRTGTDVLL